MNLVSWSSKEQPLVVRSSTKAEYRALAHITYELIWLESLLQELTVAFLSPTLLCDDFSAILLSHNPIIHARTKYIELDIHFVCGRVISKKLQIQHVSCSLQLADALTKPIGTRDF